MDWGSIIAMVLGGGGVLSGLWGWLSSRRMNEAQAKATETESHGGIAAWAESVIKQAEDLTKQHKENADFWKKRTIEAEEYSKEVRAKNRELGKENRSLTEKNHHLEMDKSELKHQLAFMDWKKCERKCPNRIPPRDEEFEGYAHEGEAGSVNSDVSKEPIKATDKAPCV